jgi:hypothetical protein
VTGAQSAVVALGLVGVVMIVVGGREMSGARGLARCFCGCGRALPRFPLGTRAINGRGRQVIQRLAWERDVLGTDLAEITDWRRDGEEIAAALRAAMHGDVDPRSLDERVVRDWQRFGRDIEVMAVRAGAQPINAWLAMVELRPSRR